MKSYNPDSQLVECPGMINLRDLGDMPLKNGKNFKRNVYFRSGSPSIAGGKCVEPLKSLGVKTVIDLRSEAEVINYGNPFKDDSDTRFENVSLFLGDPDSDEDPTMIFLRTHKMGEFYINVFEELKDRIVRVLRIMLETDGVTLFHCAHGKDRTGIIAAILYLIAEADHENIVTNYKLSYEYAKDFLDPLIAVREEAMKHTLRSDAENMELLLDYINNKYTTITNYLISGGMTESEIELLKRKSID